MPITCRHLAGMEHSLTRVTTPEGAFRFGLVVRVRCTAFCYTSNGAPVPPGVGGSIAE